MKHVVERSELLQTLETFGPPDFESNQVEGSLAIYNVHKIHLVYCTIGARFVAAAA